MNRDLLGNIERLEDWFFDKNSSITAFSGGIDSTLVLYLSRKFLGKKGIGCISVSPSLKRTDYAFAIDFCKKEDIELEVIETKEFQDPNYLANPANRCYFCKSHLYEHLLEVRKKYPESVLINGANADDTGDYRPGQQAADELDIKSPLVDCGIDKASVRELARYFNLPNWNKPASPCLSSRVPYGLEITPVKLKQIESAEAILTGYGFSDVRVRHFDGEASIEVPSKEILLLEGKLNDIVPAIKALGFTKVCIDREGLVSGKLNRALKV